MAYERLFYKFMAYKWLFKETQGVTVSTYQSRERDFPAFYTRKSGYKAPYNVDSPHEAANLIATAKMLNINSGILISVAVPDEFAMNGRTFPRY